MSGVPDSQPSADDLLRVAPDRAEPVTAQGFPSPVDWRDEVLYSVLIDRFAHAQFRHSHGDPTDGHSRHGGNLPGLTARLDYLAELGVSAVQLSPVLPNEPMSYHGYGPLHLMAVDPALGTIDDLRELVEQAHQRGIRIVLDLVLNHVARVFEYPDGDDFRDEPAARVNWRQVVGPAALMDPARYTRQGMIRDWKDEHQASRGDFPPGYRRLASEDPATADLLIRLARWWVRETDVDGVRVDAIRHLDSGFVTRFCSKLRQYAAGLGKRNFLIIGEYSTTTDEPLAECLALGVGSVYLYPEYRRQSWALHGQAPASSLADSTALARRTLGEYAHDHGVRFIDNHDVYRFLRDREPLGRLHAALAFGLFSAGIPLLYYGTEQAFRQATQRLERECSADRAAPDNREDMFADGGFTSASSAGDKFDTSDPTFCWTSRLLAVRRTLVALRRGRQTQRWSDPARPGIHAFSRHTVEQEVLVAINTADEQREASIPVGALLQAANRLVDVLDSGFEALVVDGAVSLQLDPHRVRVLVAESLPKLATSACDLTTGLVAPGALPPLVISCVTPTVDGGRFPAKAVVGQSLPIGATAWWHGVDPPVVRARFTGPDCTEYLLPLVRDAHADRYVGSFKPSAMGCWTLRIEARQPGAATWVLDEPWPVFVDPEWAAAGAWYSLFPRSTGGKGRDGRPVHGTLHSAAQMLPHIAALGFDVVHLTPIHPIGLTGRKGPNGAPHAGLEDPGCPWAVGSPVGGHDAVHPELGTLADLRDFVATATAQGLRVALELAIQGSPDHPWLAQHPDWFDGGSTAEAIAETGWTDIVAIDFDAQPEALAVEVCRVLEFWIASGIRMFRIDNPHSKPASFWHRVIWDIKLRHPDVVFLAEAFTRPALQEGLSALGFSQSLTYFMWRESKEELTLFGERLQQLTDTLRPNLFPANHDVLPHSLRHADPPAFALRAALAGTLAASWGMPSGYELGENEPDNGRGWRDSEKFQLRARDVSTVGDGVLPRTIQRLNAARRAHPALRQVRGLRFHHVENPHLIAYSRHDATSGQSVLCIVTLDALTRQHGLVDTAGLNNLTDNATGAPAIVVEGKLQVTLDPHVCVMLLYATTEIGASG